VVYSAFRELEPYDGKLSSTVLRGQGRGNPPELPDKCLGSGRRWKNRINFADHCGIVFGMLSYVFLKLLTGKVKDISLVMIILAALFILKFFI